jgi:hypothetical protein
LKNSTQLLRLEGFGQVVVHAGGKAHLLVTAHGVGGHGNNGNMTAAQPSVQIANEVFRQFLSDL